MAEPEPEYKLQADDKSMAAIVEAVRRFMRPPTPEEIAAREARLDQESTEQQERLALQIEERFLLKRSVRRKYGESIGDAEAEAARLREIVSKRIHIYVSS